MSTENIYKTALVYAQYKDIKNSIDDDLIELMLKDIHLLCNEYSVDFKKITQKINNRKFSNFIHFHYNSQH